MPGGFLLLPLLAWWLDRRARRRSQAAEWRAPGEPGPAHEKKGAGAPFFLPLWLYFEDDVPLPVVAPGALAGDSVPAPGLAGGVVVPDDEGLLLGEVVLGVVVVLEGLLVSSLPQPYRVAATMTIARICFTMGITSSLG